MLVGAAAAGTEEAGGVAVVEMDQRVVFLGQGVDLVEVADDAVHREHAVGGDQLEARAGGIGGLELGFQVGHVVVGVAKALRLGEADAVDDRRVVERVGNDRVLIGEQHFEEAAIRIEAGRVEDGVLGAEESADLFLELLVEGLGAADEAHAGHAEAPAVECVFRGGDDLGVVGQAEVVVGAHVDHLAAVLEADDRILGRVDQPLALVEAGGFDFGKRRAEVGSERVGIHGADV